MPTRVGEKVLVKNKKDHDLQEGKVVDRDWHMMLIEFPDGRQEWHHAKYVYKVDKL